MIEIHLRDFARTGEFGPVALGQSREQVCGHLGEPSAVFAGGGPADRLAYGSFEFCFSRAGNLRSVHNACLHPAFGHFDNHQFENDHFRINPWFLSPKVTRLSSVTEILLHEGMMFTVESVDSTPTIHFPSRVSLRFDRHEHHGRIGSDSHAELFYFGLEYF